MNQPKPSMVIVISIMLSMLSLISHAQISGTVFRDYNGNGTRQNTAGTFIEPLATGIVVNVFNAANTLIASATTAGTTAPNYSFTAAQVPFPGSYRVEFVVPNSVDFPSFNATTNRTNIQFFTATTTNSNFAINTPDDFWNNNAETNPKLLAISYAHGDINHTNSAITSYGILQIDNNTNGHTPAIVNVATQSQVGSLWGMAYQKNQNRYFFGSFLKRHVGFGTQGVGGVYMANLSGANYALSGSFNLQGVTPANSSVALNMGSVNRVSTPNTSDFYLATNSDALGKDLDAFAKVGKVGFGDLEVDEKNQQLILVNLNQRRIVTVDISGNNTILNNASAATLSPLTRAYDILSLPGIPSYNTTTQGQLRPFALKIYKGRGYLGITGDASVTPRDSTNLRGYILSFDPANIAAGFTTEISLNLNYRTSSSNGNTNRWHSWADTWADVRSSGLYRYPEPLISDIDFDENGGMNISVSDRFCHQMGIGQTTPVAGSTTIIGEVRESGDLLHACRVGTSWVMEGSAGSCSPTNTVDNADGYGDGQTVGVREWFDDQSGDNNVGEFTQGATAKLMGTNQIVVTMQDPTSGPNTTGEPYWYSAGMHWYDVNTGGWTNWTSIYDGSDAGNPGGGFMKANALGDLEFATNPQPIQIGNRIWNDIDGDGFQDANETGINGVVVELVSPGPDGIFGNADDVVLATTTTATNNGQIGTYFFGALTTQDARKPASWTGVTNILPGYNYQIRIANAFGATQQAALAGLQLTKNDVASNALDNTDSDATITANNAVVTFNTTNTNHNFDIGFKPLATIGDKVWRDDDKDGVQDLGEPGEAGVTVTLYQNNIAIGTTITDAYGMYLFDNLTASTSTTNLYSIGFTLPTNYSFTTQTNTQVTGTSNATNTTTVTGGSTATNGSDANVTTGTTGSFWLNAGEVELGVDAGIIFTQPSTNSIGDKVWYDANNDGIQTANEAGVSGVTVTLYNNIGTAVATTVTDAIGNYIFDNLADGNYKVGFTLPTGLLFTSKGTDNNSGGATDSNTDSDVNNTGVNFGKSDLINLDAASTNANAVNYTNVDAGLITQQSNKASLGDRVWNDVDNNGIQNIGDPGIPNVPVTLYAADGTTIVATTTTNAFGNYIFNNLDAGGYIVEFGTMAGFNRSNIQNTGTDDLVDNDANPLNGRTAIYTLAAGQRNLSVDAALISTSTNTASIGDKVWFDANADGVQNTTETPVGGVTVTLYNNAGAAIATTTTDVNGNYLFANLAAANYSIGFSNIPKGYSLTSIWNSNDTDANNSDANPGTGKTGTIALSAGEQERDVDAGLITGVASGLGSLGNKVWWDLDGDNVQDVSEPGVQGVTVTLLNAGADGVVGSADDGANRTTTTNALGEYIFTSLPAGNYAVQFGTGNTLPVGATVVTQNSGTNDAADSDGGTITSGTSTTSVYNLAAGEDNLTVDLGIRNTAKGSFGDRVWFDNGSGGGVANDGIQNGSEKGVAGVMVTLVNATGQSVDRTGAVTTNAITTTTDINGYYSFADLTAGASFAAKFSNLPAGFNFTTKAGTGSSDNARSDADLVTGLTPTLSIVANTHNTTLDAGIVSQTAALGNYVWLDNDGDGVQEVNELGIPGVTVVLYRPGFGLDGVAANADDALPVTSMITNQNGEYLFENLIPGIYTVEFTSIPSGTNFTQTNNPGDNGDNTNSDANTITGLVTGIELNAGEVDLTIDAGLFKPRAVIGNYVWADNNNDGTQNSNEPHVPGMLTCLFDNNSNMVAVAVTDATGKYLFPNVAPGAYTIHFSNLPQGASFTSANQGGDDEVDSDVVGATVTGINVLATTVNLSFDAGVVNLGVLPIKLISFVAQAQNNNVQINWAVATETNVLKYEVEYSVNGSSFNTIGLKNATNSRNYNVLHTSPKQGLNYYRLKVIDNDGKVTYSEVRIVNFGSIDAGIKIYPTPATNIVNITVTNAMVNKPATFVILSIDGRMLRQQTIVALNQTETINVSQLASGKYILRIATNNEVINKQFEVIK